MTTPHTASTSDARKRLAERNAATQADTSVEAVALTQAEREAIGERICWNCSDRNVWAEVERIVAAHVAAALADALNRAGVTGGGV